MDPDTELSFTLRCGPGAIAGPSRYRRTAEVIGLNAANKCQVAANLKSKML
jgi:hypothetical protein